MAVSGSRSGRMAELQLAKGWRDQQREISPERTKVWTEPANGKLKADRRVPVVYYLSRNGQLEHPHFMEVPLSSPHGLFLGDVINRLNVLRGKGMAAMYSWSCKRYESFFGRNFLILEAAATALPPPESQITAGDLDYPQTSDRRRRNQSCSSIDFNLQEYSVYKAESSCRSAAADASTQTGESRRRRRRPPPEIVEEKSKEPSEKEPQRDEIEISPPPSDSSPETLETLMKADGRLMLRTENAKEESTASKQQIQRAGKSSVLMQLLSCGSMSFKDCGAGQGGLGLISQYKMRVPRGGVRVEEKEYFSGSLVETKKEEFPTLKRSTSYNGDR
ncbi:UNVERIFIED_CONTAM: protein UPSTREAM OF FLC [Sesamum radiatum]|uniref:Protein UPSTREAM OF FLC n=1 Tax=Sesamum radiatum TaxID=300843 RepID=A0AAW2UMA9_SESRA